MSSPDTSSSYEQAWRLAGDPDPHLLYNYLRWIVDDPARFEDTSASMQWFPPGFSSFLVTRDALPDGRTRRSLQLNLYHMDYPGNEEPHGHSRNARATWYALPATRQIISRYAVLDPAAPQIDGTDIDEYAVAANCIVDLKDGRRPAYHPIELSPRLLVKNSVTKVAPMGSQVFNSTEVHHVGFEGPGVAVSVHYKDPEEVAALSDMPGLVYYKGLTADEAEHVLEARSRLAESAPADSANSRLGPTTMMYGSLENGINVEAAPVSTPPVVAETLLLGALRTAERLRKLC